MTTCGIEFIDVCFCKRILEYTEKERVSDDELALYLFRRPVHVCILQEIKEIETMRREMNRLPNFPQPLLPRDLYLISSRRLIKRVGFILFNIVFITKWKERI